jgi:hypothetical protein
MNRYELMKHYDEICDLLDRARNDIPGQFHLTRIAKQLQMARTLKQKREILWNLQADVFSLRLDLKDIETEISGLMYELEDHPTLDGNEDGASLEQLKEMANKMEELKTGEE